MIVTDCSKADNPIIFVNQAFTKVTGYSSEEAIGRNCRFLQGVDTDRQVVADIREAVRRGLPIRCELLNYCKDGRAFWADLAIDPIKDEAGNLIRSIGIQYDASEKHAALSKRLEADQLLADIINHVPGYVFQRIMQPDGTLSYPYFSASIFRILGLPANTDWTSGQSVQYLHPDERDHILRAIVQSGTDLTRLLSEFRFISPSGEEHWFRTDSTPRALADGAVVWNGLAVNISAQKSSESRLERLAYHDGLTGLANRVAFRDQLLRILSRDLPDTAGGAIFYIDLDGFETINEDAGYAFGDRVLRRIGLLLKEFSESHGGTAARLGGDEFAVVLPALSTGTSIQEAAEAICREVSRPMLIDQRQATVQASVGAVGFQPAACADEAAIALYTTVMKRVRLALQSAKQSGSGTACLYSSALDDRLPNKIASRQALQLAIQEEQLVLHYQPLVNLISGAIVGAEALVRWDHPELGLQGPNSFIPFAESTGMVVPLGAWVLKMAMKQSQIWRQQGVTTRIAINVSSIQLQRPDFVASVEEALDATGAQPRDFELEITEGILIASSPEMHSRLNALKTLGFDLVLDDFGTGHSTFKYLRAFDVDKIKIDQIFVRQLVIDSNDASIIRAMIALSRSLHLAVVAEGIETAMQHHFLRDEGCNVGQGYLFSPPMSAEDFAWMLQQGVRLPITGRSRADDKGNNRAQ